MKIAFLSYEYPPETGGGGIGTYLAQMVDFLPKFGHKPVVFCGTKKDTPFWENKFVYRIPSKSISEYNQVLLYYFHSIHTEIHFDICEGTDFGACGIEILRKMPQIPFIVRAHTAHFLIDQFLFQLLKGWAKWRFIFGGLKRLQIPRLPTLPKENNYLDEKEIIKNCDLLLSPSHSLGLMYKNINWNLTYTYLPYLYNPQKEILEINQNIKKDNALNIVFYGRLEIRKGVLEIAEAIPKVLKKYPKTKFYFIGKSANSPKSGVDMKSYLQNKLANYLENVSFQDAFQASEIASILTLGDIFLIPSRYDNSPLVCYETMAAGKPVIATNNGGMAELIEDGISGLLVNPKNVKQLIQKTIALIENNDLRLSLGKNARNRILSTYNVDKIIPQQIGIYQKVIDLKNN